jgi:hypothetical protein
LRPRPEVLMLAATQRSRWAKGLIRKPVGVRRGPATVTGERTPRGRATAR